MMQSLTLHMLFRQQPAHLDWREDAGVLNSAIYTVSVP